MEVSTAGKRNCCRLVLALVLTGLSLSGVLAGSGSTALAKAAAREQSTIHITSDHLEARQKEQQVIFSGNVVASEKDLTIQGDRLTIYYEAPETAKGKQALVGQVERIVVQGNVRISQGNRVATGEQAVYYHSGNKIVLTGEPRLQQDKDFVQGERITLFLDSKRTVVEGGENKPVEATIHRLLKSGTFGSSPGGKKSRSRDNEG
ncbi:MAG: lipopolysaccharide transport periplasmic protein LptA [Deltaproteobacteria bacterium]|nr:lipopolysaccharide transport periplasmic protein LptA [Deltaproteobacteria bacterium]MBW2070505.1 lipopolysaccharide transport periplasmic protein LptA [Deltaproteobacteria bacterium]